MADTKVSATTVIAAVAGGDKIPIADVSDLTQSYHVTPSLLKTFVNDAPVFAAGSASAGTKPKLTSGTVMTTPEAGALEYDGTAFYATEEAGNRGVWPAIHFIIQNADRSLTNDTSEQKIFDSVTNGTLTLAAGTYFFDGMIYITGMSSSSGNATFDFLGAGTATVGTVLYEVVGEDATNALTTANQTGVFSVAAQSAASMVAAGAGTQLGASVRGVFRLTVGGTLIPSVTLVTASAATLVAGSYFRCYCVGGSSVISVGDWS